MESNNFFRSTSSFFDSEIIDTILKYSEEFEDHNFKCDILSLINFDDNKLTDEEKMKWLNYEWRRIPDIFNNNIKLLDNVSSIDVMQGSLGNCYLLSACGVIAEYPNRLEKLFKVKEINKAGIYSIQFYIDGEIKNVIIDDRIPYDKKSKSTPFCKISKSRNIWPILIEKAWAKHLGNYQNTIAGHPNELFKILTGAPSYFLSTDDYPTESDREALWHKLQNFYFQNYFICAATLSKEDNESNHELSRLLKEIKLLGVIK
jgi:calpain-15